MVGNDHSTASVTENIPPDLVKSIELKVENNVLFYSSLSTLHSSLNRVRVKRWGKGLPPDGRPTGQDKP